MSVSPRGIQEVGCSYLDLVVPSSPGLYDEEIRSAYSLVDFLSVFYYMGNLIFCMKP